MAKIKSYTDINQSKKLAEILPLESADMLYYCSKESNTLIRESQFTRSFKETNTFSYVLCWSLAALSDVLPNGNMLVKTTEGGYYCLSKYFMTKHYDNPIDACYEMILKLYKLNLL